jgi:hypothetical protein
MSVRATDKNPDKFVGLKFPLNSNAFSTFNQSRTLLEQTKSNLRNLLLTSKGERPFQPEFGSDLTNLLFEPIVDNMDDRIEETIRDAIDNWLPYVNVNNVFVVQDTSNPNLIQVQLEYFIETDKESLESVTFNFNRSIGE